MNQQTIGHLIALFTVSIWGTTFIATKILLESFSPIEILFIRFFVGFLCLSVACPHLLRLKNKKQEIYFMLAGICGVTLYFLFENIALTYTMASNVGVIVAISPFFTALFSHIFNPGETLQPRFFLGFLLAIGGIALISFNGQALQLNPLGDLLAAGAAIVWALYTILTRKIGSYGYPILQTTRHIFFYGLLFMLPALLLMDFHPQWATITAPKNLANLLFLGMGASACCFASWNMAVNILDAVKTSIYIYLIPVITVISSALILHEQISPLAGCGMLLTLLGLIISEGTLWQILRQQIKNNHQNQQNA